MKSRRNFLATGFMLAGATGATWGSTDEKTSKLDDSLVRKFIAKSHGDLETVKELLKAHPQLIHAAWDWGGGDWETGLNAASHVGRRDVATFLLENGARLDVAAAVMLGMTGVIKEMLKVTPQLHANPGAHRIPLLSHAIFGKSHAEDVFELLLSSNADVNAKSNLKMTPLMAAATTGNVGQLEALLKAGADANVKDFKGRTALDMATRKRHTKCLPFLQRAMRS